MGQVITEEMFDAHDKYISEIALMVHKAYKMSRDKYSKLCAYYDFHKHWNMYCDLTEQGSMSVQYTRLFPENIRRDKNVWIYEEEYSRLFKSMCKKYKLVLDIDEFKYIEGKLYDFGDVPF